MNVVGQLFFFQVPDHQSIKLSSLGENKHYEVAKKCVEDLALYLKPLSGGKGMFTNIFNGEQDLVSVSGVCTVIFITDLMAPSPQWEIDVQVWQIT